MSLLTIAQTFVGIAACGVAGALVLRVWGYRLEIKLKPIRGRRRRRIEPDEHTQFL